MKNVITNDKSILLNGTVCVPLDIAAVDQKRLARRRARSTDPAAGSTRWALQYWIATDGLIWYVN